MHDKPKGEWKYFYSKYRLKEKKFKTIRTLQNFNIRFFSWDQAQEMLRSPMKYDKFSFKILHLPSKVDTRLFQLSIQWNILKVEIQLLFFISFVFKKSPA